MPGPTTLPSSTSCVLHSLESRIPCVLRYRVLSCCANAQESSCAWSLVIVSLVFLFIFPSTLPLHFTSDLTSLDIQTARFIARECGILTDGIAMEGSEFRALSEAQMDRVSNIYLFTSFFFIYMTILSSIVSLIQRDTPTPPSTCAIHTH